MAIQLPKPIADYFAADRNAAAAAGCFSDTAVVTDEDQTHVGHTAIRSWVAKSSAKYSYVVEPFEITTQAGLTVVTAHFTGSFPGSPVDLRYRFALDGAKIASLDIGTA